MIETLMTLIWADKTDVISVKSVASALSVFLSTTPGKMCENRPQKLHFYGSKTGYFWYLRSL